MTEFLKLILPVFLSVENYDKMRQKLASFVFYEVYLATFFLRRTSEFGTGMSAVEQQLFGSELINKYELLSAINPIGIVVAFIVAALSYVFHFHDRVSDLLGIRRNFGRRVIIARLADETGTTLDSAKWNTIAANHDRVMSNIYYKYTSSTNSQALVDRHDISQALDSWTWFWIALEGSFVWAICTMLSVSAGSERGVIWFGVFFAVYLVILVSIYPLLKRRAVAQVEKIADNHQAKLDVSRYLNAL